jgi:PAS domain S-box-containing protein
MVSPDTVDATDVATILNVDDTDSSRYTKTRLLRQAGYSVIEASTAADALRAVREQLPQLVLLDVNLPDMNGIDVARQIKKDSATCAIPIVQISATFITPHDQEVGLEGGAEIYLTEPLQPQELVTVVRVLLRLHRTERGLLQSETRWKSFVESNIVGVAIVENGAILEANDGFLAMFGYERADLALLTWQNITPPDERPRAMKQFAELMSRGTIEPFEREYVRRDGSPIWVTVGAAMLGDAANRWLCFLLDVSERKRAALEREAAYERERIARRQAEEATQLKDEFLANLSHELRTPMNAIIGWSHLLRHGGLEEADRIRAVESIDRAARSQAQLIEDLLDVSRIVSGKLDLAMQRVDLAVVVEAAIETERPAADAKGLSIAMHRPIESVTVDGDPQRLQQVVLNLLTNAVKFTPMGGRIDVTVERSEDEARIAVTDTGEGMAPDFLPYAFDRFRQADGTSRRKHAGLGLGLEIVRQVVELHGGSVRAESEGAGRGATFTVSLPLAPSVASGRRALDPESVPAEPIRASGAGVRVLVVENDAETRAILGAILDHGGFSYRMVNGAASALDVLDHWQPHVIVSDIGMPDVDGYEFMRQLRARPCEKGGRLPALALSAFAREEDRRLALASGYQGHIAKPVDPLDLVKAIHAVTGDAGAWDG